MSGGDPPASPPDATPPSGDDSSDVPNGKPEPEPNGKLIIDAVFNRDYAVVQGVVLVTATAYILLNLLADMAYFVFNPRLRH